MVEKSKTKNKTYSGEEMHMLYEQIVEYTNSKKFQNIVNNFIIDKSIYFDDSEPGDELDKGYKAIWSEFIKLFESLYHRWIQIQGITHEKFVRAFIFKAKK